MTACFKFQVLDKIFDSGDFTFDSTGVVIGAGGISGLRYKAPLHQHLWQKADTVGQSTLSSEFDALISAVYAEITTELVVAGTGEHVFRQTIMLPEDFASFPADALAMLTRHEDDDSIMALTMYKGGAADLTVNAVDVTGDNGAWKVYSFQPGSAFLPGDLVTLEFVVTATAVGQMNKLAAIELVYVCGQGNF
jgi:hypothetical protein